MSAAFTVKEYAAANRVAVRTVWRWIERGTVTIQRTPGGGVRIQDSGRREVPILSARESDDVRQNPS